MGREQFGWSSYESDGSITAEVPSTEQAYPADSSQGRALAKGLHNPIELNHAASTTATAPSKECSAARRFPRPLLASTERYVLTSLDAPAHP